MSGSLTSSVSIANRALAAVGTRSTIASFTEGSNESNNVSLIYAAVRQQALRAARWNFARATATLSLLKSAPGTAENPTFPTNMVWSTAYPPPGWSYEYAYPSDCLAARKVVPNWNPQQGMSTPIFPQSAAPSTPFWEVPGQKFEVASDLDTGNNPITVILANVDQAILVYTRDIVPEPLWDPQFQETIVMALAGKLALALTGDKALAELRIKMANDMITEARRTDGNEGWETMDHVPDWITAGHGARWLGPGLWGGGWWAPYGPLFSVL
jgi:hypothetical protein